MNDIPTVSVSDLDDGARLLDVRERDEFAAGHAPGAQVSPIKDLATSLGNVDINERIPVICRTGQRSAQAAEFLRKQGFDAVNVEGGMKAWVEAGKPMETSNEGDPEVI